MENQWLSIAEYARHFDISDMTVRRRIKTGKLRAVLKEGKYFIPVNSGHAHAQDSGYRTGGEPQSPPFRQSGADYPQYPSAPPPPQQIKGPVYPDERFLFPSEGRGGPPPRHSGPSEFHGQGFAPVAKSNPQTSGPRPGHQVLANQIRDPKDYAFREKGKDVRRLIASCDRMLTKLEETEKHLKELAKARESALQEKVKTLEEKVSARDLKVSELMQKIEDMQLLIRMMEKKNFSPELLSEPKKA